MPMNTVLTMASIIPTVPPSPNADVERKPM
jgi:hypothetical protein